MLMKTLSILFFTLFHLSSVAQNNFTIAGKIELLSQSTQIILSTSFGEFKGKISSDGSFIIKGNISTPSMGLIKADRSGSNEIWVQAGEYNVIFREIKIDTNNWFYFRIPELKGPKDAEIYHRFSEPQFYIKGNFKDEILEKRKKFHSNYIDSIFKTDPSTAVLPEILRFSTGVIGDEKMKMYISLLNEDQKKNESIDLLTAHYNRKDKIEKEKHFQDFQMSDQTGDILTLSSLNKKLILIDFWSSDCLPCRRKHVKLVELYAKYAAKGLEIVSVSLDDNKADWLKAIEKDKMTWTNVSELKGWNTSLALNYFIKSLPYALWLDGNRKIIGAELSEKEIEDYLK
jgi:thiol-disulfide isomerase/thioredoxin